MKDKNTTKKKIYETKKDKQQGHVVIRSISPIDFEKIEEFEEQVCVLI